MQQKHLNFFADFLLDLGGAVLYSIGIGLFAQNAGFAPGGISGLALLFYHLWKLPVGLATFLMNIPLVILSYRYVGRRFLLRSLRSVILCTILLDVVFVHIPVYSGNQLLAALFSGVFVGAGMAIFYMRGSSSGGADLLTMTIKVTKPYLSIGFVTMAIDFVIICLGWPVFGSIDAVLYGVASTAATSIVLDRILNGASMGKLIFIITEKGDEIAKEIDAQSQRGATRPRPGAATPGRRRRSSSAPAPMRRPIRSERHPSGWTRTHLLSSPRPMRSSARVLSLRTRRQRFYRKKRIAKAKKSLAAKSGKRSARPRGRMGSLLGIG